MTQWLAPRTDSNNVSRDMLDEKVPPNNKYASEMPPPPLSQNARNEAKVTAATIFFLLCCDREIELGTQTR
jgi:hypothetical protein